MFVYQVVQKIMPIQLIIKTTPVVIHVITIMILQSKESNVYQTVQKIMTIMSIMNSKDMNVFRIVKTVNIHI